MDYTIIITLGGCLTAFGVIMTASRKVMSYITLREDFEEYQDHNDEELTLLCYGQLVFVEYLIGVESTIDKKKLVELENRLNKHLNNKAHTRRRRKR